MKTPTCSCNTEANNAEKPGLVYPCSGAADVGEIADRAARRLDAENKASMSCLAGIGGRVSVLMGKADAAPLIIALDGCAHDCARKTLELAGYANVRHVRVTDFGFKKGDSPANEEAITTIACHVEPILADLG